MGKMAADAKPVIITYICDTCGKGEMRRDFSKPVPLTNPVKYPHVCGECGAEKYFEVTYPYHILKPTESLRELKEDEE